jgi:hypothetical protein
MFRHFCTQDRGGDMTSRMCPVSAGHVHDGALPLKTVSRSLSTSAVGSGVVSQRPSCGSILALRYATRRGVIQDDAQVVRWVRRAAEQRAVAAQEWRTSRGGACGCAREPFPETLRNLATDSRRHCQVNEKSLPDAFLRRKAEGMGIAKIEGFVKAQNPL